MVDLNVQDLHPSLNDPALWSMNFLNEVANRYPNAISFAPGRPYEGFYEVEALHRYLRRYCQYLELELGYDRERARRAIFQYGPTKGIIGELIARQLSVDEGITVDPEAIVVTVGCQEAMLLVLRALRADERDVVLAVSPTYAGLVGAARLVDLPVMGVRDGPFGVDLDDLAARLRDCRREGRRPRALYVIPDFANPSGLSLSGPVRAGLLELAAAEDFLVIEDNPYGLFYGAGRKAGTLKALDRHRRVIHLGSLSKTCLPGARVGYVVADQPVQRAAGDRVLLADYLALVKGSISINTSPVSQAVVGGKLLESGCSLARATARERDLYRGNLELLLRGLDARFGNGGAVRWNAPSGGFFAVITLPFAADEALLELSAREFGVLWTPMRYFYDGTGGDHQARLSISVLTPAQIEAGLDRLAALVAHAGRPAHETSRHEHRAAPTAKA